MKKRLLALALCLVLMTSLLPITAAAETVNSIVVTGTGFGPTASADWGLQNNKCNVTVDGKENATGFTGQTGWIFKDEALSMLLYGKPVDGETFYCQYGITASVDNISYSELTKDNCFLTVNGYSTECVELQIDPYYPLYLSMTFKVTKDHDWRFTVSKNNDTLTAQCQNQECRKELSVSLKADSVTLPNSPFNARLEGLEQFKKEVPGAVIGEFVYKYKGPDGWSVVAPTAANAKAGEYQVGVRISGLPNKEYGPVAMSLDDEVIPDGVGYADLYMQYTAVDPKVTAQTGDNRPIELMMASVLVFSALAAAAFILDNKRKYSR